MDYDTGAADGAASKRELGEEDRRVSSRDDAEADAALRSRPEMCVNGIELLALALLRCGIAHYYVVPGSPATKLIGALEGAGAEVHDAHDEKTAVETALGRAVVGAPAGVVAKGSGGLLLAEALQNAGPHALGGLLVLLGDDVFADSSTVPTDSREVGRVVQLPVFEIPDPARLAEVVDAAWSTSIEGRQPVIIRFTRRLEGFDGRAPLKARTGILHSPVPDRIHVHMRTKRHRYLDFLQTEHDVRRLMDKAPISIRAGAGVEGLVVAGAVWHDLTVSATRLNRPVLGLSAVHPLPDHAVRFCRSLERVVVLEEGRPHVEDQLSAAIGRAGVHCEVRGQRSGHVPPLGPATSVEAVHLATSAEPDLRRRRIWKPSPLAAVEHPYGVLFDVLRDLRLEHALTIHSCVGSCVAASYPPWQVVDSALCLGSAINLAAGAASGSGSTAIALIGDYGIIHSGLSGHDQVYQRSSPVLTVVLANGRSDKTGGQPSPVARDLPGGRPLDLIRLLTRSAPEGAVVASVLENHDHDSLAELVTDLLHSVRAPSSWRPVPV